MGIQNRKKMLKIRKRKIGDIILELLVNNYYLMVMFLYLIVLKQPSFRVGVYSAIIMAVITIFYVLKYGVSLRVSNVEAWIIIYLCIVIFSGVNYIMGEGNVTAFFQTAANSVLPITFFWCGKNGIRFSRKTFLFSFNICCLIGIYLLIKKPTWYYLFCIEKGYSYTRLSSCFGSTAVGTLSCIAMLYTIEMIKDNTSIVWKIQYLLSCSFVLLSMQRSAWIAAFLTLIILHYWLLKWKTIKPYHVGIEIISSIVGCFVFWQYIMNIFNRWILEHKVSGEKSFEIFGRTSQWIQSIGQSNWLTGSGLGMRGHRATVVGVADGDWIRLLCEIGIVGVISLLIIIVISLKNAFWDTKRGIVPAMIIVIFFLQAIGSNVFEFQILAPVFWMSVGEIVNYSEGKRRKRLSYENDCVISSAVSQNT